MILYIIRHGIPDYETDTLLPEGVEQAKRAAQRLNVVPIDAIYSSPMGRARGTAQPLADLTGLPVQIEDWAYELGEECETTYPNGEKTLLSRVRAQVYQDEAVRLLPPEDALRTIGPYVQSGFPERYRMITNGLDDMLARNGYARMENGFYRVVKPNDRRICLFCHAGMTRVLLAHLMNIPVQTFSASLMIHYTGITVLYFRAEEPESVCPMLISVGDTGHLYRDNVPQTHYVAKTQY